MSKELLQQALEALEYFSPHGYCELVHHKKSDQHRISEECPVYKRHKKIIIALRDAIAQPLKSGGLANG